jgi:phospholipid transport system substrate-binding protein
MQSLKRFWMLLVAGLSLVAASAVQAQAEAPDEFIKRISGDVIEAVKADKAIQAGDIGRIHALVDSKIMPHVNFNRMAASSVGRPWRTATPEQKKRLEGEFKALIVRTYAGAMSQVKDHTVQMKPFRGTPSDTEVVVRSEVKGRGEPIQLDYRLEKADSGWKVYDVNVMGVWMVEQYRNMFAQEIQAGGLDGLIAKLAERNKLPAATKS